MAKPESGQRLLIFAKAPNPGEVKTRLQPPLTAAQCALLHRRLVEHSLAVFAGQADITIELWVGSEHPWWPVLSRHYQVEVRRQRGKDLGARMFDAFARSALTGDKVLIIGTDCPFMDLQYVRAAFDSLNNAGLVLGPADDGGYVLIGATAPQPLLFEGIDWGTDRVLQQTRRQARSAALLPAELATLRDIDRPEDLRYLQQRLPALTSGLIDP